MWGLNSEWGEIMAATKCAGCGLPRDPSQVNCPNCGAKSTNLRLSSFKYPLIILGCVGLYSILRDPDSAPTSPPPAAITAAVLPTAAQDRAKNPIVEQSRAQSKPTAWDYSTQVDPMTSKKIFFGIVSAREQLHFEFPYSGGVAAWLQVRSRTEDGTTVSLRVDNGQFNCTLSGCSVKVRFDDKPPIKLSAMEPNDHRTTALFLSPSKKILEGLRTAKVTRIEAEFFHEGPRIMTFDTEGLTWPPKD